MEGGGYFIRGSPLLEGGGSILFYWRVEGPFLEGGGSPLLEGGGSPLLEGGGLYWRVEGRGSFIGVLYWRVKCVSSVYQRSIIGGQVSWHLHDSAPLIHIPYPTPTL